MRGRHARLVVAVLGYRARPFLDRGTLASIRAAAGQVSGPVQIVYLDNYSRDGSVQWLSEHAPDVDLLLSPANSLYCAGVNTLLQYGARRYQPEYYLLADADNPVEPGCYRRLLDFLDQHPSHGLAQPQVRGLSDPAAIYSLGHRFTPDHWCRTITEPPADRGALMDLPSCSISSTAVRAEVFERCGLLDLIYEMYYESADLGARARARGFRCACVPEAVAYNDGTDALGPDSMHHRYYFTRNRLLFWRIHDAAVFQEIAGPARAQLADLESRLKSSEFGLDPLGESVRRGLSAGLREAAAPDLLPRRPPALHDYDKTAAVLLQTGSAVGGRTRQGEGCQPGAGG